MISQVTDLAKETLMENKDYVTALVIEQQTVTFVDSIGNPLRTVIQKYVFDFSDNNSPFRIPGKSIPASPSQMEINIDGDMYEINSPATLQDGTFKSDYLEAWNGTPIMDLTPENKEVAKAYLQPLFVEKVNQIWD